MVLLFQSPRCGSAVAQVSRTGCCTGGPPSARVSPVVGLIASLRVLQRWLAFLAHAAILHSTEYVLEYMCSVACAVPGQRHRAGAGRGERERQAGRWR